MKNFLNHTFEIGQFVAYPVRQGSSMWMSFGIIHELKTVVKRWTQEHTELRIGVTIVRMGKWSNEYDASNLTYADGSLKEIFLKKVTVSSDRMVILNQKTLPSDIVKLLKSSLKKNKSKIKSKVKQLDLSFDNATI